MKKLGVLLLILSALLAPAGCSSAPGPSGGPAVLMLATTTSTYDSGLLHFLFPDFEAATGIDIDIVSVGTGQAIEIGKRGDADILLVHERSLEDAFVADGYGTQRWDVMYNEFLYLGNPDGPAWTGMPITQALQNMMETMETQGWHFVSRGDDSGTHVKELSLWPLAGQDNVEAQDWYLSTGQGMGDVLITANEMGAYVMTDRGTYLAMQKNLPNLGIVFEGDENLFNPYGIIPVDPDRHPHVKHQEAMRLVEFFVSDKTQARIAEYGREDFGQPLFFADAK